MESGWIKIHRKIREHWIWGDSNYLKWWLDLIMLANHKPVSILINGKLVLIEQGMYHTSLLKLSERWSVNRKTVSAFLNLLQSDSMISVVRSRKNGTTIKLSKYAAYQDLFVSEWTAGGALEGQPAGHIGDNQLAINKNEKNDQEKKETHPRPAEGGGRFQDARYGPYEARSGLPEACMGISTLDMPEAELGAFNAFWEAYPKKVSKGAARKAWKQIRPDSELLTKMLASLERAKTCAGWMKEGGQYIPYPATWLRAEGWEDELGPARAPVSPAAERRES